MNSFDYLNFFFNKKSNVFAWNFQERIKYFNVREDEKMKKLKRLKKNWLTLNTLTQFTSSLEWFKTRCNQSSYDDE